MVKWSRFSSFLGEGKTTTATQRMSKVGRFRQIFENFWKQASHVNYPFISFNPDLKSPTDNF